MLLSPSLYLNHRKMYGERKMFTAMILAEIVMKEFQKQGGVPMNWSSAAVYPIMSGIEILYFGKTIPEEKEGKRSVLCDDPNTIAFSMCMKDNFCFVHRTDKKFPAAFFRYQWDVSVLIAPSQIQSEDFLLLPEVERYIRKAPDAFQINEQFCVIKVLPQIREIFDELLQIPLPPTMFKFYMQIKVMELMLQFDCLNMFGTNVHFYPYGNELCSDSTQ